MKNKINLTSVFISIVISISIIALPLHIIKLFPFFSEIFKWGAYIFVAAHIIKFVYDDICTDKYRNKK